MKNLTSNHPNNLKILKEGYKNWIENGINNNLKDYYSITLLLNSFNKFNIQKDKMNESGRVLRRDESRYKGWREEYKDGYFIEYGSREKYSKCLKRFFNKLNDKVFGNNWNRRKEGIDFVVSFFESNLGKDCDLKGVNKYSNFNPHYHIIIKKPSTISELKFRSLIFNLWVLGKFRFNKKYYRNINSFKHFKMEELYEVKWNEDRFYDGKVRMVEKSYSFVDYGLKQFNENKIDFRNCNIEGIDSERNKFYLENVKKFKKRERELRRMRNKR